MAKEALISLDAARTLAHVALLAAWEGDSEAAEQIFSALQAARPKEPNIRICRAMVYACQDRFTDCLLLLDEVLAQEPRNMSAKSLRGFVMYTLGEHGWREMLEEVVADGSDVNSIGLARRILDENPRPVGPQSMARPNIVNGYYSYA